MRLFIALKLSPETEEAFDTIMRSLRHQARAGVFVPRQNLHCTLAFLGEREPAEARRIQDALELVHAEPFGLRFTQLGSFSGHGDDGRTWWIGTEPSAELRELHKQVQDVLLQGGLLTRGERFVPHVTLGRQIRLPDTFDAKTMEASLPRTEETIDRLWLMRSDRTNGKLVYTHVYERRFR